jgi:hypothetical protein
MAGEKDENAALYYFMQERVDPRAVLYGHFLSLNNRLDSLFQLKNLNVEQLLLVDGDLFKKN